MSPACVSEGPKAVMNVTGLRNPDWGIPVIYTRAADGRLFVPPGAANRARVVGDRASPDRADSLILRSYEKGIISALQLPLVLKEWREPSFEDFQPRTTWSLFNAFTSVLRERATLQPSKVSTGDCSGVVSVHGALFLNSMPGAVS